MHALSGIRIRNPSNQRTSGLRLRPKGTGNGLTDGYIHVGLYIPFWTLPSSQVPPLFSIPSSSAPTRFPRVCNASFWTTCFHLFLGFSTDLVLDMMITSA